MQEQTHSGDERVTVGTNTCSHSKKGDYDTDFNIFQLLMIGRLSSWDIQQLKERSSLVGGDGDTFGDVDGGGAGDVGGVGEWQ